MNLLDAAFLGIIEGLTEFLPVSSTGHLILFVDILKLQTPPGRVLEIVIQLGAVFAIVVLYWRKFWVVLTEFTHAKPAQYFVRNLTLALLPAILIGALAHDVIKALLFNPTAVALAMVGGGFGILLIEKYKPVPRISSTERMPANVALIIGLIQCIAMIPGMSRSGATIMGALLCGVTRKAAAEFSFFLAVPTIMAAASYNLYVVRDTLSEEAIDQMMVGFVVSFIVALFVVRWLVNFVKTHGFYVFAWYRIIVGTAILALLAAT